MKIIITYNEMEGGAEFGVQVKNEGERTNPVLLIGLLEKAKAELMGDMDQKKIRVDDNLMKDGLGELRAILAMMMAGKDDDDDKPKSRKDR